ncbi:MAG: hypothetical protein WC528_03250 [Patescibacteria group bacterium]
MSKKTYYALLAVACLPSIIMVVGTASMALFAMFFDKEPSEGNAYAFLLCVILFIPSLIVLTTILFLFKFFHNRNNSRAIKICTIIIYVITTLLYLYYEFGHLIWRFL